MTLTSEAALWMVAAGLVVLSAFLTLAEASITRVNRIRAGVLAEEGRRGARRLEGLVERPDRFVNPVLVLALTCNVGAALLAGVLADRAFGAAGVAAVGAGGVALVFVLAVAVPKTLAVQNTDRMALLCAPVVAALVRFPPLRAVSALLIWMANVLVPGQGLKRGPFVSEEALLAMADVAEEEEVIERQERALIHSIIEFGDTVVREVMVPRPDMVTVDARARLGDVMEVIIAAGYSRIPVYEQGIDDVIGIVYAKDLMRSMREGRADLAVRELVRPAQFVPETKRVAELMPEMQRAKAHMAIVVDEYGGTAGLVTLEDLIEELVGEIVDEYDVEEAPMEPLPGGGIRVNARMSIDEVNELLGTDFPHDDFDTVGGLVFNLLGHVPTEGEAVDFDGHRLRAEKVQGRRIGRVRIARVERVERVESPATRDEAASADDAGER